MRKEYVEREEICNPIKSVTEVNYNEATRQ